MPQTLKKIVAYAGLAYGATFAFAAMSQHRLLYPAPTPARPPKATEGVQSIVVSTDHGMVLGLYAPPPEGAPTVVHFHGNGEQLADVATYLLPALVERGVGVLAVEYPGYGMASEGEASETSLVETAEAMVRYLVDSMGTPNDDIVLMGQSLGSGVAVELAQRGHGARIVLISPYTSIVDMTKRFAPWLPASWFVRDRFASIEKAPTIDRPVLVVHGERDRLVPPDMGRRLAAAFPNATLRLIADAGHNDIYLADETLLDDIVSFARGDE